MAGTSLSERISWAEENLGRQLDWIERHDSRSAMILGISVGMLGFLVTELPAMEKLTPSCIFFSALSAGAIAVTLVALYLSHYPRTDSPNDSLVFFGTIAQKSRKEFSEGFCSRSETDHLDDLCDQTHINAAIITKKFSALKVALIFLLAAVPIWIIAIMTLIIAKDA